MDRSFYDQALDEYRLALSVCFYYQSSFPDNEIDWYATFYRVETRKYRKAVIDALDDSFDSPLDRVYAMITFGQQELGNEAEQAIEKSVQTHLRDLNLA